MTPTPPQGHAPSIEDVARLAGVSAQTVSRVSRQAPNVKESTRSRVLIAMNQLGYAPNRAARALRSGTFHTIGVITQNLERTGENLVTAGIAAQAEEHHYSVNLLQVSHPETSALEEASTHLSHQAIDGLIIVQAGSATSGSLSIPRSLPTVVSDSRLIDDFPSVTADQIQGTRLLITHLLEQGHRTIAHIAGPSESRSADTRLHVWKMTLEEAGITPGPIIYGDWSAQSGYCAAQQLSRHSDITAIFSANDEMAFGAIRALNEAGRRVPDEVSIAGFDGISLAEYAVPPLTTVHQDFQTVGRSLVDLLLERIENPSAPIQRRVVPSQLLIRGSTGLYTPRRSHSTKN
ncbi:LacI family DNA-binding transcriptional regulator [Schaalia vaccimaxillae]|uniref:LacI family DNA-binding transcriptional regulator n=1 Tax=Schaalia vaccimaxillae TaxID=183916 RepID=UPI0003B53875|nr:LacI family DNA-binding transcriptional regulator [Schaalia vaccimaxillae]